MYTTILHATDLSEDHFDMCEQAKAIATCFHAKLYLLHVIEPPPSLQLAQGLGFAEFDHPIKDDAQTVLGLVGEAIGVPKECQFVEVGSIKMNVLRIAEELAANLIIVGSHTRSSLPPFLGSTAHAVIHHAKCDVLTIRTKNGMR